MAAPVQQVQIESHSTDQPVAPPLPQTIMVNPQADMVQSQPIMVNPQPDVVQPQPMVQPAQPAAPRQRVRGGGFDLSQVPSHIVQMYKKRFDAIDLNKDGMITLREMAAVGKVFGYRLHREELAEIFGKRDLDDSGGITFDEFIKAMIANASRSKTIAPIRVRFRQYDKRDRGYITADEAYPILRRELGFDMNKTESLVDMFDKNRDYRLSIQEFVAFNQKVEELKAQIMTAFKEWDKNNDGYVDFNEARAIMGPKGFSDEEVRGMFVKYDLDGDARLNFEEFAMFWDIPLFT